MQLYVDGSFKYSVSSGQLNTSVVLTSASHHVSVVSTNASNLTTKASIDVTVQ
jgi:hypothetical protein